MTGFPGFIAGRLLKRLLPLRPSARFFLLVQPKFVLVAKRACEGIEGELPEFTDRWHIVPGDIRRPDLGMPTPVAADVRDRVTEVWHLAALYDLTVAQSIAYAVNVEGTENVLDFCRSIPKLRRLSYVSTCYVAGDRTGRVYEDELDRGQDFKNHYEATKFWAETKVARQKDHLPITILRPSIVVGDSTTGETQKGDGPYMTIRLLTKLPRFVPMVHLGASTAPVNLVPVDFVIEAMARLSADPRAEGETFQLADPTPLTAREILELTIDHLGRAPVVGTVPARLAYLLDGVKAFRDYTGLPRQVMDYFNHHVELDVSNTARLLEDQLQCPRLRDYWPTLVDYAIEHPSIFSNRPRAA